jgi:hypothetical protein
VDLAVCHTSDTYSFEVAPRFLENCELLHMNCSKRGGLSSVM